MADLKFVKISWEEYQKECILLSKKVGNLNIDTIVAISRGGMVIARILSDLLALPVSDIVITSYKTINQRKEIRITEIPSKKFDNETVLIVDDVSDTGETYKIAYDYFKNQKVKKIYTLSLHYKSKTKFMPDFTAKKIDGWIIYPYELRETYDAFVKLFGSPVKAKIKLIELGFKNWEVNLS